MTLLDIEKYMVEEYFKFKNMDEVNFYNFFELGIKYVIHINVRKCLNVLLHHLPLNVHLGHGDEMVQMRSSYIIF